MGNQGFRAVFILYIQQLDVLSSEKDYENIEVSRVALEPTDTEEE